MKRTPLARLCFASLCLSFLAAGTACSITKTRQGDSTGKTPALSKDKNGRVRKRGIFTNRQSFQPQSRPASHYGSADQASSSRSGTKFEGASPREQEILKSILEGQNQDILFDSKLSAALRDYAFAFDAGPETKESSSESGLSSSSNLLEAVVHWHGRVYPSPELLVGGIGGANCEKLGVPACEEAFESVSEELSQYLNRQRLNEGGEGAWVGLAVVATKPERTRVVLGVSPRQVVMNPFPRRVLPGNRVVLSGKLVGEWSQARIEMVTPAGKQLSLELGTQGENGADIGAEVDFSHGAGIYQIELLADGEFGPVVLANFPVYCGVNPPSAIEYMQEYVGPETPIREVVKATFEQLNAERKKRGLRRLKWSAALAKVATGHSEDMRDHGFVGHRSPTTGGPGDRVKAAKIQFKALRENIARGYGPSEMHQGLMNSPGHRANIVAPGLGRVGIGAVFGPADSPGGPRPVYLTQLFAD